MTLDTYTFFEIILSGFIMIKTYRLFQENMTKYSEFEWLGLSAFWGLIIMLTVSSVQNNSVIMHDLIINPLNTGIVMSMFGIIFGWLASIISRRRVVRYIIKTVGVK